MRKIAFALIVSVAAFASGQGIPAVWQQRYDALTARLNSKDVDGFLKAFDNSFKSYDSKGRVTSFADFAKGLKKDFKNVEKADAKIKLLKASTKGDLATVSFDFKLALADKQVGMVRYHEIGTDTWRNFKGEWKLVKTVDKKLDVTRTKQTAR